MKIIDNAAISDKSRSGKLDFMRDSLGLGRMWLQDFQAQELVISSLQKVLDNRYIVLRNVVLEGLDIPIPLVLVGPSGVRVLYISSVRGVYRVRGISWEILDERQQRFKNSLPNLVTRTQLLGRAVETFLANRDRPVPAIEATIVFTDPGVHVESVRPAVRVVLMDGLDRFVNALLQSRNVLSAEETQSVVDLLSSNLTIRSSAGKGQERDAFSFQDEAGSSKISMPGFVRAPNDEPVLRVMKKIPITPRQWIVLGCMMAVNIFLLIILVIVVLLLS
jgi:hypothetical protein